MDTSIDWLLGNTGVWQKLTMQCEFEVAINFDTSNPLFMEEPNIFTLGSGKDWSSYGFEVGDSFEVKWTTTVIDTGASSVSTVVGVIEEIDGSTMISDNATLGLGALASNIYPVQLADDKIHSVYIRADKQPQTIKVQYGHLTNDNSDSTTLSSFIDGTNTLLLAEDTDTMSFGGVQAMLPIGNRSGMSIASANITYVAKQATKYIYDVEFVFMISSFGDLQDAENNRPPSSVFDNGSLTDNFLVTGYTTANNPNIKIQNDPKQTKKLGNTGFFDENYNGLANDFTVSSVNYFDTLGNPVNQLDFKNPIQVRAVIDGVQNVSGLTQCAYGFAWIPSDDVYYSDLPSPYYENVKINTGGSATTFGDVFSVSSIIDVANRIGYSNDGASMDVSNVRFENTSTDQITFEALFTPNASFTTFMQSLDVSERTYRLWVSVADQNEVTNKSNRVSLNLGIGQLDTQIVPIGELDGMIIGFLDHTQDETDTPSLCGNDIRIEDDILAKIEFTIDTVVGDTIPVPTALQYGVLVERDSDGFQYVLDKYSIDLTQYPTPSQYNFSASRGFKLESGNNKDFIKAEYYPSLDTGTKLGVLGLYGFKVRWEDWLGRNGVPTEFKNAFYDSALASDGISNDWYRYLLINGWSVYFYVFTDALLDSNPVRYENKKQLIFKDYDANSDISTTFTYKRESDGAILTGGTDPISGLPLGVILSNEPTRLEIEYTRTTGTWASINDVYGVNTIEVYNGAGQMEYRQLSSIWGSEIDNPLLPITGGTLLDLVLVSPTVVRATCLIDPNKLIKSNRYKITGREGCK